MMKTYTPLLLLTLWTCASLTACGQTDRPDREDESVVFIDADAGTTPDDDLPPASMDARCAMETCSDHGVCQILAGEPVCVCQAGFQARGLRCEALPVGAPQILSLSAQRIRLTQGERQEIELVASFEGQATARLLYIDPEDPGYIEPIWDFEPQGEDTFVLELSWQKIDELFDGIFFDETYTETLTLRLEDDQGRILDTPMPLILHCDGAGGSACDGACVDLATDREHCGRCNTPTPDEAECQSGQRVCHNASLVACDEGCMPSNDLNCGRCGNECGGGAQCNERGGFCDFSERYVPEVSFHMAAMVGGFNTNMVYQNTRTGKLTHLSRFSVLNWENVAELPSAPEHPLFTSGSFGAEFLVESTALIEDNAGDLTFAYVVREHDSPLQGLEGTQAAVYVQDYIYDEENVSASWSAPVRLDLEVPAVAFRSTESQVRLMIDRHGAQRLAYRSTRGIEFHTRSSMAEPWRQEAGLDVDFARSEQQHSTSFGYVYDVLSETHHVVFADVSRYVHAWRGDRDQSWQLSVLDHSLVNIYRTSVSKLFQGPDGFIHVVYRVEDQLVYRVMDPSTSTWHDAQSVTPKAPDHGRVRFDPSAEGFDMDEMGNKWLLASAGNSSNGKHLNLFARRHDSLFWDREFVSGGLEYYYGTSIIVDSVASPWSEEVTVHMLAWDRFNQANVEDTWHYTVHTY